MSHHRRGGPRIAVHIDEVVVTGATTDLPQPALVQRAVEREVRRLVMMQPAEAWQSAVRTRVQAPPAAVGASAPFADFVRMVATGIVSAAAPGSAASGTGKRR